MYLDLFYHLKDKRLWTEPQANRIRFAAVVCHLVNEVLS